MFGFLVHSPICVLPACDAVDECRYRKAADILNSASDISPCMWCMTCADFSCLSYSLLNQTWPLYSLCHAWTMQNFDVVNFAAFWSQSWPLVHDARTMLTDTWCRALILCVSQSPEVRHGCCMWCSNSTELGCYMSRSLLKSDIAAVCDVSTVQNLDAMCLAVSWSQTWLPCVMY